MDDVIVVGAGPAGSLAAAILARAGAQVRVFDRARFPRAKLCGDTLNPGAMRVLGDHLPIASLTDAALPLDGMLLTGPGGVRVRGDYGAGVHGCAIRRRDLDAWLIARAEEAGAGIEQDVLVREPIRDAAGAVCGVMVGRDAEVRAHRARMVIAADGRASRLARACGLASHPARPRRWAIGGYFSGATGMSSVGEMHVRRGRYIGVAPVPGGAANVCLVVPYGSPEAASTEPARTLTAAIAADPVLRDRFAHARLIDPPKVLGPMAVDSTHPGVPGMLLAGDAAGFIDPITGDGLRFALGSAVLAAAVASRVLAGRVSPEAAVPDLARQRRAAFQPKWRFNRAVRGLVASSGSVTAAALAARAFPSAFEAVIRFAGDCPPRA